MRNTLKYPITKAEALETIEALGREYDELELVGGTRGLILEKLREIVDAKTTDEDWKD